MSIPQEEIEIAASQVLAKPNCLDPVAVASMYRKRGLRVIQNPNAPSITAEVIAAMKANKGFSAIRIGDGEANLLTYGSYSTPGLETEAANLILTMQSDSLRPTDTWLNRLKRMLHTSIHEADIIGVRGLWLSKGNPLQKQDAAEYHSQIINAPPSGLRGLTGVWRATDYMLQLAEAGALKNKLICSAHLYLSILGNLKQLLSHTSSVYLITENSAIQSLFEKRFPGIKFILVPVGKLRKPNLIEAHNSKTLAFLGSVFRELPKDMRGSLSLVAAGVWSEIYCTWIRRRGGTGVDIGSGIDLLSGECTRPVHYNWGLDQSKRFSLLATSSDTVYS